MDESGRAANCLATVLQELRAARGWSLDVAANRTRIGRRSLVALEHGDGNPSLSTLLRLAEGYDVGLADLLGAAEKPTITARREAEAPTLWSTEHGSRARLLIAAGELELWLWDLAPGDIRDGDSHRPGTKEIVHVQRGRLAVIVGADREDLGPGRVAIYAGDRRHRFENPGSTVARFALFVYEPVR
jgi:transcriptional regulator with XRE-family HTH domain